jgi:hypothetical protein
MGEAKMVILLSCALVPLNRFSTVFWDSNAQAVEKSKPILGIGDARLGCF